MSRIEQAIQAAQGELASAQALGDADESKVTKVAAAQAKVSALQNQKKAIEDEISDAVRSRVPDAETSGKEAERKAIASALGIPVEQFGDEKLAEIKQAYQGQQTESERLKGNLESVSGERDALKGERDAFKERYENTLKASAVERELLAKGVRHGSEDSRLAMAVKNADFSKVTVKDDGTVEGADKAADGVKQASPEWFSDYAPRFGGPPPNPRPDKSGKDRPAYAGNYSIPGKG